MHSLRGMRGLMAGLGFAFAAMTALPVPAHAGPDRDALRNSTGRYRLFAGNTGAITINQVYYGLTTKGEVGVDSTNSSTVGGGYWPKGTGNQYMFNSGLQVAGIITGDRATNPWATDTSGGLFFDARGTNQHGTAVTEIYNSTSPTDVANWPQAAYVPQGDFSEEVFDDLLRGRVSASQGDVWFVTTEADPALNGGRAHPLGIMAEYRVMGWNFPTGNQDLVYLIITLYNITSSNPADYAQYRDGMREMLIEEATKFHTLNNAKFGITLPAGGYTIDPFYAAFAADPDVTGDAGTNFSSVNMPFAMGYAYHPDFPLADGWSFPPSINAPPFFAGVGFVGMKYLKSPTGGGEIALFSNTCNGCGDFNDPSNTTILFKYLSGKVTPADGVSCNQGDVEVTHICWVKNDSPSDMRLLESASPVALAPGDAASIVIAYIHAAPVAIAGYPGGPRVFPGDPTRLLDAGKLQNFGANTVDSLMGFVDYTDGNADGIVQQAEFTSVPGSLLSKAQLAQEIFDNKFLLPFAPEAPDFFLIPGDEQVTVVWRPSLSEETGDPFFQVAQNATTVPEGGGAPVVNTLYDPDYRQFDVEGYRIYRGRASNASSLELIAQYDYGNTTFDDYTGQVVSDALGARCAPEIGVTETCDGLFDERIPGEQLVKHETYPISGNFVQVLRGGRVQLVGGDVLLVKGDTAVTGGGKGFQGLLDTGVPFAYLDNEVYNGLTYFYAVTAYDINSITSTGAGNTSLESALIPKSIQPGSRAGNYTNEAVVSNGIFGRNGRLTDEVEPTIDPATGMFDKKALPSNGVSLQLAAFVKELLSEPGEVSLTFDSAQTTGYSGATSVDATYYYTLLSPAEGSSVVSVSLTQSETEGIEHASGTFTALEANSELAAAYNAPPGSFSLGGVFTLDFPSAYYVTVMDRGCVNSAAGFNHTSGPLDPCAYNGPRWFEGPNETVANPNSSNTNNLRTGNVRTSYNNVGGGLTGVTTIFEARAYDDMSSSWRDVEGVLMPFASAADYQVYWGAAGAVDSVIDVTHDVEVPFSEKIGSSWGILNQAATQNGATYYDQRAELTMTDIGCIEPMRTLHPGGLTCTGPAPALSRTAVPGAISYEVGTGSTSSARTSPTAAGQGFIFYLRGHVYTFELAAGVPAEGTMWTVRNYVGAIEGGTGDGKDGGDYVFTDQDYPRPFNAPGASAKFAFELTNAVVASTDESIAQVHTVPDPYYVTSPFEATTTSKTIKFVNLPAEATIRIYTTSGVLVRVLKQSTTSFNGEVLWDVRNRNNQFVASGVYFYHVTAENGKTMVGRMTIINYAQ